MTAEKNRQIKVAGALIGDIVHEPFARVKYGYLFAALEKLVTLVVVHDATLRGADRLFNAAQTFNLDRRVWRECFYKNMPAFRRRSQKTAVFFHKLDPQPDIVLQLGATFDTTHDDAAYQTIIYADYTARLSARKPAAGRSPFTPAQCAEWQTLEQASYQRAVHICTRSAFVRRSIIDDYGIAADKVSVIGGGANLAEIPPLLPKLAHPPTALFIGKEFYRKGGDLLLTAFARIRQELPDARLLMVTDGPIPEELSLNGVEIIPPTWDREIIKALYRQADLFVLPSRLETWGDVLLEAMAYGLPCIGVADDAMSEIIISEQTGLIVPPEDVDGLQEALQRLLQNRDECKRLGAQAHQRFLEIYTWDKVAEQLYDVMEKVVRPYRVGER